MNLLTVLGVLCGPSIFVGAVVGLCEIRRAIRKHYAL